MSISLVLEVAISMVFLYLLGSQIVLLLYELSAGYRNVRGKFLYQRLVDVLGQGTAQDLYAAPEITKLTPFGQKSPSSDTVGKWAWWWGKDGVPAYLPADLFAAALLRIAGQGNSTAAALSQAIKTGQDQQPPALDKGAAELLTNLLGALAPATPLADCQKALAVWYDAFGERLTGWYKRRVRGWLFLIGLLLAFFINIDSPHILHYLWLHPQVSLQITQAASQRAAGQAPSDTPFLPQDARTSAAATATADSAKAGTAPDSTQATQLLQVFLDSGNTQKARLLRLGFPVGRSNDVPVDSGALPSPFFILQPSQTVRLGRVTYSVAAHYLRYTRRPGDSLLLGGVRARSLRWRIQPVALQKINADSLATRDRTGLVGNPRSKLEEWFNPQPQPWWLTWLGWLLTAAALSVGAPFWFDLLCRLVNIRNLGIKPPRTGHE